MEKDGGEVNMLTKIREYRAQRKVRKWNKLLAQENNTALAMGKGICYHHNNIHSIILGQNRHPNKKIGECYLSSDELNNSLVLAPSSNVNSYQLLQADINQDGYVDPIYPKSAVFWVEGISHYLQRQYEEQISEDILLQELITFFEIRNNKNYEAAVIWKKIKEITDYSSFTLETMVDHTLEDVLSFLHAQIVALLSDGRLKRDETFSPRITNLFDSL